MRRSILFKSAIVVAEAVFLSAAVYAQPGVPGNSSAQDPKPPVSLSPAMPVVPSNSVDPAKMAEPAGAKPATAPVDVASFVLGAEDQITISMWDDQRFNGNFTIRPDGMISLPLIGEIKAMGLTPMQLQDAVNKAALGWMTTPQSTVNVVGVHSKHLYFDGEGIGKPGPMDLVIPLHLLDAISSAGDFKDFADKKHIRILRGGKNYVFVNGNKKSISVSYSDITSGKHPEANPLLLDGDHVIVN